MREPDNACGGCRRCCQDTLVRVKQEDLERWRAEERYDIILCLESWMGGDAFLIHKKDRQECIFLTDTGCEIYPTRPSVCRRFPSTPWQVKEYACALEPVTHLPREPKD
jgi:Fe-S-cluster containining protein